MELLNVYGLRAINLEVGERKKETLGRNFFDALVKFSTGARGWFVKAVVFVASRDWLVPPCAFAGFALFGGIEP